MQKEGSFGAGPDSSLLCLTPNFVPLLVGSDCHNTPGWLEQEVISPIVLEAGNPRVLANAIPGKDHLPGM